MFRDGLPGWIAAGYPTTTIEKLPKFEAPNISPAELKSKLDAKGDFVLLDIRVPTQAKKLWISSRNVLKIHMNELPSRFREIPAGKQVIIMDLNGKRAPIAARFLSSKGFKDLAKLSGGIQQWVKDGLPTEYGK